MAASLGCKYGGEDTSSISFERNTVTVSLWTMRWNGMPAIEFALPEAALF
jgi:hypothetical protein